MPRWFRRVAFRCAFKGCKADDLKALAFARTVMGEPSIESAVQQERALVLHYFARRLRP